MEAGGDEPPGAAGPSAAAESEHVTKTPDEVWSPAMPRSVCSPHSAFHASSDDGVSH